MEDPTEAGRVPWHRGSVVHRPHQRRHHRQSGRTPGLEPSAVPLHLLPAGPGRAPRRIDRQPAVARPTEEHQRRGTIRRQCGSVRGLGPAVEGPAGQAIGSLPRARMPCSFICRCTRSLPTRTPLVSSSFHTLGQPYSALNSAWIARMCATSASLLTRLGAGPAGGVLPLRCRCSKKPAPLQPRAARPRFHHQLRSTSFRGKAKR